MKIKHNVCNEYCNLKHELIRNTVMTTGFCEKCQSLSGCYMTKFTSMDDFKEEFPELYSSKDENMIARVKELERYLIGEEHKKEKQDKA